VGGDRPGLAHLSARAADDPRHDPRRRAAGGEQRDQHARHEQLVRGRVEERAQRGRYRPAPGQLRNVAERAQRTPEVVDCRRVTGDELCAVFTGLGFDEVSSFLASGNVVFATDSDDVDRLTDRIEDGLAAALGYEVTTFLRTGAEVAAIAGREPFPADVVARTAGKLQVALLPAAPTAAQAAQVLAHASDDDHLAIHGRELYWLPSQGISTSALPVAAIARLIGPMTIRTANTLARLHARSFAD
jgi:uncharacterized protein (DUF1697 family)